MPESAFRIILYAFAAINLGLGLFATIGPSGFFDEIGRYGAYNCHYVGDIGAFHVAIGIGFFIAASRPSWREPILIVGALWYGLHALNHALDTGEARSEGRGWADAALLALGGLVLAYLAAVGRDRASRPR